MKKSKKKRRAKQPKTSPLKSRRLVIFLATVALPVVLVGGYLIDESGGREEQEVSSKTRKIDESSSRTENGPVTPAIYADNLNLREVYEQINCVCGKCNKTLADCTCPTANVMRNEVASAGRRHKTDSGVLNQMVDQYGKRVLSSKKIQITAFVKKDEGVAEKLPSFAYNSAQTLEGYRIATQIPHVLEVMPCYCGCGPRSGHRNLKDCFIKPNGNYDDHGAGCDLCEREAMDVKTWLDQNVPIEEIRARIDEKYEKFGPPTNTPAL